MGYVWEHIESTFGLIEYKALNRTEQVDNPFAAGCKFVNHILNFAYRRVQSCNGGTLCDTVGPTCDLTLYFGARFGNPLWCTEVADTPTCHRKCFCHSVDGQCAIVHGRNLSKTKVWHPVVDMLINLI